MSTAATDKSDLKARIRTLKQEVASQLTAKEGVKAKRLRRKIKLLKRTTRHLAKNKPPAEAKAS